MAPPPPFFDQLYDTEARIIRSSADAEASELISDAISKYGLTETKAEQSVDVAKDTITEGFQNELKGGNISGLLSLFQGKTDLLKNPIVLGLISQYSGKLISQLGLSTEAAEGISKFAIPFIMNQFTKQTEGKDMDEGSVTNTTLSHLGLSKCSVKQIV